MKMKRERSITGPLILALTTVMVVFWLARDRPQLSGDAA